MFKKFALISFILGILASCNNHPEEETRSSHVNISSARVITSTLTDIPRALKRIRKALGPLVKPHPNLSSLTPVNIAARAKRMGLSDEALGYLLELYAKSRQAKKELDTLTYQIVKSLEAKIGKEVKIIPGNIKSIERSIAKIALDYEGNPRKLTDLVRNTLVVPDRALPNAIEKISTFSQKTKTLDPNTHPLGYDLIVAKLKLGSMVGEVQILTPGMVYASYPESIARYIIGDELFNRISRHSEALPNQSHTFYEMWRSLPFASPKRIEIEGKAKEYHHRIRKAADTAASPTG